MPNYNGQRFIKLAIESILSQTYSNFEFLIIDDGSTDGSIEIIKSFKDKRIKLVAHNENLGLTKRLNEGLSAIKTESVARMDTDDIAKPDRLLKQIEYMNAHPTTILLGCNYEKIDENGKKIWTSNFPIEHSQISKSIISKNPFSHSCFFFRRKEIAEVGSYDQNFKYSQDYELALKITAKYKTHNLPDVLMEDRFSSNSITEKHKTEQIKFVIWAQLRHLFNGNYPFWQIVFTVKTLAFLAKQVI